VASSSDFQTWHRRVAPILLSLCSVAFIAQGSATVTAADTGGGGNSNGGGKTLKTSSGACSAVDGRNCIFPFFYRGQLFSGEKKTFRGQELEERNSSVLRVPFNLIAFSLFSIPPPLGKSISTIKKAGQGDLENFLPFLFERDLSLIFKVLVAGK